MRLTRILPTAAVLAAVAIAVAACGDSNEVSFETLEGQRAIANDNSLFNAQRWRAAQYGNYDILPRGDSTQAKACPQGDGWASVDLISPDRRETIKLKCSTASANIGCMLASDFKERANLAGQEGRCNDELPVPLPKLVK